MINYVMKNINKFKFEPFTDIEWLFDEMCETTSSHYEFSYDNNNPIKVAEIATYTNTHNIRFIINLILYYDKPLCIVVYKSTDDSIEEFSVDFIDEETSYKCFNYLKGLIVDESFGGNIISKQELDDLENLNLVWNFVIDN